MCYILIIYYHYTLRAARCDESVVCFFFSQIWSERECMWNFDILLCRFCWMTEAFFYGLPWSYNIINLATVIIIIKIVTVITSHHRERHQTPTIRSICIFKYIHYQSIPFVYRITCKSFLKWFERLQFCFFFSIFAMFEQSQWNDDNGKTRRREIKNLMIISCRFVRYHN